MRGRWGIILGAVAALVIVGAGSFYGGIAFQRSQQASAQARFFAARGGRPGAEGFAGGGFLGGAFPGAGEGSGSRGVFGTVKSIDGDTLLVSTAQDVTTVKLADSTVVEQMTPTDRSALKPGQQVTVRGQRDNTGAVTAVTLQILAEPTATP